MYHRAPAADCRDSDIKRRHKPPRRQRIINQQGYLTQLVRRSNYTYDAGAKKAKQKRNKAAMKFYPINPFAGYYLLLRQMNGAEARSHVARPGCVLRRRSRATRRTSRRQKTCQTTP